MCSTHAFTFASGQHCSLFLCEHHCKYICGEEIVILASLQVCVTDKEEDWKYVEYAIT